MAIWDLSYLNPDPMVLFFVEKYNKNYII